MADTRRRWLRFSLRSFFALITLTCLMVGLYASQAVRQRNAVAAVHALGGSCRYDDDGYYSPHYQLLTTGARQTLVTIQPPEKLWLRLKLGEDWFANVVTVTLRGKEVTNAELQAIQPHLARLARLRRLELHNTAVTDRGLQPLHSLTQVNYLSLFNTRIKIDDAGLLDLRAVIPQLRVGY